MSDQWLHVLYRATLSDNVCLVVLLTAFVMFYHVLIDFI